MAVAVASAQSMLRSAMVAGANGLTGSALVAAMLRAGDYARVEALTRRPLPREHPRLANRILNYEQLEARLVGVRCDDAFCCLGAAGGPRADAAQLRKVDLELALAFARAARAAGATRLVVVSAAGADRGSQHPFLHIKGELEGALRELKYPCLDILQPGVVVGERAAGSSADTWRLMALPFVNLALQGRLQARRWISGTDLAAAMLGAARAQRLGVNTWSGKRLRQLTTRPARPA
jgi:uncharacterized protein YbjT (DUF2867 family)